VCGDRMSDARVGGEGAERVVCGCVGLSVRVRVRG